LLLDRLDEGFENLRAGDFETLLSRRHAVGLVGVDDLEPQEARLFQQLVKLVRERDDYTSARPEAHPLPFDLEGATGIAHEYPRPPAEVLAPYIDAHVGEPREHAARLEPAYLGRESLKLFRLRSAAFLRVADDYRERPGVLKEPARHGDPYETAGLAYDPVCRQRLAVYL
jgi:hypothetical protein